MWVTKRVDDNTSVTYSTAGVGCLMAFLELPLLIGCILLIQHNPILGSIVTVLLVAGFVWFLVALGARHRKNRVT